jgi:hypothetical protein
MKTETQNRGVPAKIGGGNTAGSFLSHIYDLSFDISFGTMLKQE